MKKQKTRAVYQLKVSLRDIEPLIWRRIRVWEDTKLPRLHRILQLLFNWEDYHLHEFILGRRVYAEPDPEDELYERNVIDERQVPLNRLVDRVGDEFDYHYDFGDNWRHRLLLEAILLPEANGIYPRCVAGARNGPPEDAGGPHRYADYLEALRDPDHEEHEEMLQWRGPFDAEEFSLDDINAGLNRSFQRRKKAATAPGKASRPELPPFDGPQVAELTQKILRILDRGSMEEPQRKRIPPSSTVPLELTDRERELILDQSFAGEDLTRRLRIVPPPGQSLVVRYTLDDLDDLAGYVAAEANHTEDRKLRKEWDRLYSKIAAILETHTNEEDA